MLTIECSVAIITVLFNPLSTASNLISQLHNFFSTQLTGMNDEVRISTRIVPNLLLPYDQPLLLMSSNSHLWGDVNVLACCGDDRQYLRANAQATRNYMVVTISIARGGRLEAGNVRLKRGRLNTLLPCTVLDINQLVDTVSLRDLSPNQPIQLTQLRQAWRVKAGQRVNVIASGDGFSANTEGQALSNATVAQNARVRMISGQVVSGVVDADGNILINL